MKLDQITVKKDEYYTPKYAIDPILRYIPSGSCVWCPFDLECSNFVLMLRAHGCEVVCTHIAEGSDFFELDIECDYIISNPPYSLKNEVFTRLFSLNRPFAMLVGVVGLFESQLRFDLFRSNPFEILYLNRRVAFFEDYSGDQKASLNPPFSSVFLTSRVLPDQIQFAEINKKTARCTL